MIKLMERLAKLTAILIFFIIFIVGILSHGQPDLPTILFTLLKASVGALMFWIVGLVVTDIVLKGMLESIESSTDTKWEGGLLTRFAVKKEEVSNPSAQNEEPAVAVQGSEKAKPPKEEEKKSTK